MPWPAKVARQFEIIPPRPDESEFHGAYNKLLSALFPPDTDFTVVPQRLTSQKSSNYIIAFEVFLENRPVFILQLNKPADLNYISWRHAADEHIRERVGDLVARCPIPTLHAVSAMGTRLCFYSLDTANVEASIVPLRIPRHPSIVNDTAPVQRWGCDVLDAEGETRLRAVVNEIKEACANVANA